MSPRARRGLILALGVAALTLVVAPAAFAAAGGGSGGFSGDGGGGGGGGNGFALWILVDLLIHIAFIGHGLGLLVLIAIGLAYLFLTRVLPRMSDGYHAQAAKRSSHTRRGRPGKRSRERRVELAAAEAAQEDPAYDADAVRSAAGTVFCDIQTAWDADDRARLHSLVAADLLVEWERRLDDYERRGWRNHVEVLGEPTVELVGLVHRGDASSDHVVVRIDARMKDYVVDRSGRHLKRNGRLGETTRVREFWSLGRPHGAWMLVSIEENREGTHAMDEQIVATPWADERGMRDSALVEGAVADAVPAGTSVADVASVSYADDAQAAANDLSVADGRFAPAVLEVAARRAVDAWAQAVDGPDTALDAIATPQVKRELLYAGDTSGALRLVVRGPVVNRIRIVELDSHAQPPTMTIEVDLSGRRYLENRDTTVVVAGSRTHKVGFTERWTLSLTGDDRQPWRITAVSSPVGA